MKLKSVYSLEGKLWPRQPKQHIKRQRHYFANKDPSSQSCGFSSSHVRMWELDYKESWVPKNWCFWTVVLEKTLESPLDCKEFKQSILKEISPEYSLEGLKLKLRLWCWCPWCWRRFLRVHWTARSSNQSILKEISPEYSSDAEAETPILWPPYVQSWLIWKDPDAGKDWRWEEKEMKGWDGWMSSPSQWTWVWVDLGSWWWRGRPGVLQSMGLQRVRHDRVTELNHGDRRC